MMESQAVEELRGMLNDALENRKKEDPNGLSMRWNGYVEGIRGAIHRLEMNQI